MKTSRKLQFFNRISELEGQKCSGVTLSSALPEKEVFLKYPGYFVFEHNVD